VRPVAPAADWLAWAGRVGVELSDDDVRNLA
jgi:hypothetical protein